MKNIKVIYAQPFISLPPGGGGRKTIIHGNRSNVGGRGFPGVEQNWKGRVISALPSPGKVYIVAK
ncbi:hypothetical protein B6U83_04230 [Thermoplasmatales archaeon ex4484_36]|nr:MAG: hypothetical protein B6U83_04230 [Thermoplasmatales archaeon ex4484_36]